MQFCAYKFGFPSSAFTLWHHISNNPKNNCTVYLEMFTKSYIVICWFYAKQCPIVQNWGLTIVILPSICIDSVTPSTWCSWTVLYSWTVLFVLFDWSSMVKPLMMPFRIGSSGGFHVMSTELEDSTLILTSIGGPAGTVMFEFCQHNYKPHNCQAFQK